MDAQTKAEPPARADADVKVGGNCVESSFVSKRSGLRIHTYRWDPKGTPRAIVFVVHGIHGWTGFEFLRYNDETKVRDRYEGSIIEKYNEMGIMVCGNDHEGHGKSEGTRGLFTMETMVSDVMQNMEEQGAGADRGALSGLPLFLQGTSMGGMIAVFIAARMSKRLRGVVLVSPAVVPPGDMFGLFGRFLAAISALLAATVPTLQVLSLPGSPFEELQAQFLSDPLNYTQRLRVLSGREFLLAYKAIDGVKPSCDFPCIVFSGSNDTLVAPAGITSFVDAIPSQDKRLIVMDGLWHDLLHEPNNELVAEKMFPWVADRLEPSAPS
mmetsp:Transcript_12002/g.32317  ORF Transcript_12002/g.32317 Transcript_12002/m.32317 type:complete len:325 (-) Transcript_12002:104-1078(-)